MDESRFPGQAALLPGERGAAELPEGTSHIPVPAARPRPGLGLTQDGEELLAPAGLHR